MQRHQAAQPSFDYRPLGGKSAGGKCILHQSVVDDDVGAHVYRVTLRCVSVKGLASGAVFGSCPIGHNVLTSTARAASSSTSGELPALGEANLPILKLHALLGLELPPGRRAAALHVRYARRNFFITCDKVIGPHTIVVRPPGPPIGLIPFYAGVTASGAGKAQLVLDLGALADVAYAASTCTPMPAAPRRGQPRALVVDDS